eukprot:c17687_g1_i2.p1 GENE.c17687_g1_i2~~c17687_g1_i2.p1  ORF type:complete len:347 (-),score=108.26 c17687_g1_i2:221-1261(-)
MFTETYTSRVTLNRPTTIRSVATNTPSFKRIASFWKFEPVPTNPLQCHVKFSVDFECSNPIAGRAAQTFFGQMAEKQVFAFRKRAEAKFQSLTRTSAGEQNGHTLRFGLQMDKLEFLELKTRFAQYANKDGNLDLPEFEKAFESLRGKYPAFQNISNNSALIATLFSQFDLSGNGRVDLEEFLTGVYLMGRADNEEKARFMFDLIDSDKDGFVSRSELELAISKHFDQVARVVPRFIRDQANRYGCGQSSADNDRVQEAAAQSMVMIDIVMKEIQESVPALVGDVFERFDSKQADRIAFQEWMAAIEKVPELLDMMSIDRLSAMVQWASVVFESPLSPAPNNQMWD